MLASLLLTAGALILLLFSEMGLAANNILFIPSFISLMHLETYIILNFISKCESYEDRDTDLSAKNRYKYLT